MCLYHTMNASYLCAVKTRIMKQLIKQLFFDRELVEYLKLSKPTRELLYVQLMSGKITMKEYIAAGKR